MNRVMVNILANILAFFILILLYLGLTFVKQSVMTVKGISLPVETRVEKNFYYMELERSFVIPVGFGGECDKRFYEEIKYESGLRVCVAPRDVLEKQRDFLSYHTERSAFKETLSRLHPSRHHLVLLVRPSAFGHYHDISAKLLSMGFNVSWIPLDSQQPLVFSSKDSRIGVH